LAVGDHREPTDYDETGTPRDHRGDGDIELRFERGHWLARRLAAALPLGLKGAALA
jgi:hypothetical protein